VEEFEARFAEVVQSRHAIGVNSGTDALRLSLKALGVGHGDEVITTANTFIATVGAIADVGARTVFVDCADDFCMDVSQVAAAITPRTKAIIPVHMSGAMVDMPALLSITEPRGIPLIEDACQAIKSSFDGRAAGSWGITGAFSFHPLKFLNIWGDGGAITTGDDAVAARLRLLRNHGLESRDVVVSLGVNSRLDTLQAIVAIHVLKQVDWICQTRQENAVVYDSVFSKIPGVTLPPRNHRSSHSYVTYQLLVEQRDDLLRHCISHEVECKVHYPTPLYCQPGLQHLGYKAGEFPVTDRQARSTITIPVHQYLTRDQLQFAAQTVARFYQA
jgi:dTDP-3-amino-2,3,6-trideoxy-4-keto-D-glucose/dTDP-3-amino-3,4,6-trideoxy-alpha-D-glucose/dTDP-2,6-dideoxy-D-kanosamine transaminase